MPRDHPRDLQKLKKRPQLGKLCAANVFPRMFKIKRRDGEGEGIWLRQNDISLMTYDEMQGLEEVKVQPSWCLIEDVRSN